MCLTPALSNIKSHILDNYMVIESPEKPAPPTPPSPTSRTVKSFVALLKWPTSHGGIRWSHGGLSWPPVATLDGSIISASEGRQNLLGRERWKKQGRCTGRWSSAAGTS
jgi:hypothetical protein